MALSRRPRTSQHDVKVEDYLNDRLQTYADFETIDTLMHDIQKQQKLLKSQLSDAERDLAKARDASNNHSADATKRIDAFDKKQVDIDRRLLILTRSETSDDAVRKFDSNMAKLRKLDVAKAYTELLMEVDRLSGEARRNFKASPHAALKPYLRMQELAKNLKKAQPAAEDAAPHLVDHVESAVQDLWSQMKDAFASDFEQTLTKTKWPTKSYALQGMLEQEWSAGVEKLLDLQGPELEANDDIDGDSERKTQPLVLLPLEIMVKPLELRFKYHFDGDKPTNRLDKPEYFLSHVVGLLNSYEEFFSVHLQPILQRYFQNTNLALNVLYIDSTSAFITALLPMLRRKIDRLLPSISKQPQLLSHLMHEIMSFDGSLRDDWGYGGSFGVEGWKGLSWEVLVEKDWFGKWLQVEKDFAITRYHNIIDPPESREIDYDSVDPGITKPTKAAIRVNDLLETITDRYRPLSSFTQKLRFLIEIQITIFDEFHEALHSSLEAYLTMTSSIARTVQGISKEDQEKVQGLGGLERLCRVYGSAEYLEKKMRDWGDDVFFLELWDELQYRARKRDRPNDNFAGDLTISDVAERTSSVVGSNVDSGALFDETCAAYRRLRIKSEGILQNTLSYNVREWLRPYGRISPWASLSSEGSNAASTLVSAELDNTIQELTSSLSFLSRVLGNAPLRRIARHVCLAIQAFLWDTVLMRNSFSTAGVSQLQRDVSCIWAVIDRFVGADQGQFGMRRLSEGIELLGLPIKPEREGEDEDGLTRRTPGIWEVEKRVFQSNESAREVLEELGMELLSESDARNVLERRIELGS